MLQLWNAGLSKNSIWRLTGIARATIKEWVELAPNEIEARRSRASCSVDRGNGLSCTENLPAEDYAYLLGLYLGDGTISRIRSVFKLRIFLDLRYPNIIEQCARAMLAVAPHNSVGFVGKVGCVEVYTHSKHWPHWFPQHGPGMKHTRDIILEPWQNKIVNAFPRQLLRGLIHSDGCRVINKVQNRRYEYPRYMFSNESLDIIEIFCNACDRVGVNWCMNRINSVSIAKRESVALLDTFIGPKT